MKTDLNKVIVNFLLKHSTEIQSKKIIIGIGILGKTANCHFFFGILFTYIPIKLLCNYNSVIFQDNQTNKFSTNVLYKKIVKITESSSPNKA